MSAVVRRVPISRIERHSIAVRELRRDLDAKAAAAAASANLQAPHEPFQLKHIYFVQHHISVAAGHIRNLWAAYPEVTFPPWRFTVPNKRPQTSYIWYNCIKGDPVAQCIARIYLEEVAENMSVNTLDDWYRVYYRQQQESGLHKVYNFPKVIQSLYPYHEWKFYDLKSNNSNTQEFSKKELLISNYEVETEPKTRRQILEQFGNVENLYTIRQKHIVRASGGSHLLKLYGNSTFTCCVTEFPEVAWVPYKFRSPNDWWKDVSKLFWNDDIIGITIMRNYIDDIAREFKLKTVMQWKQFLERKKKQTIVNRLNEVGSLPSILQKLWPERDVQILQQLSSKSDSTLGWRERFRDKLDMKPVWSKTENHKQYFDYLKSLMGGSYSDLYQVTHSLVRVTKGARVLQAYGHSLFTALTSVYPEYDWKPWRFKQSPKRWLHDCFVKFLNGDKHAHELFREYLMELGRRYFGVSAIEDWETVDLELAESRLKNRFDSFGGLKYLLEIVFPERTWIWPQMESRRINIRPFVQPHQVPIGFWKSQANVRQFLEHVRQELGGSMECFYSLNSADIIVAGGLGVLSTFNGSFVKALMVAYPEHEWKIWQFKRQPLKFWKQLAIRLQTGDKEALKFATNFVKDLEETGGIKTLEDWYGVSIVEKFGSTVHTHVKLMGGLRKILKKVYPNHKWSEKLFLGERSDRARQKTLNTHVYSLLPRNQ